MSFTYHERGNSHFLSSGISYSERDAICPLMRGTSCASSGAVVDRWLALYNGPFFTHLSALSCRYNALLCIDTMRSLMGSLCLVQRWCITNVKTMTAMLLATTETTAMTTGNERTWLLGPSNTDTATNNITHHSYAIIKYYINNNFSSHCIAFHFLSCLVLICCTVHYCLFSFLIFSLLATSSTES